MVNGERGMGMTEYKVTGMSCGHCESAIRLRLQTFTSRADETVPTPTSPRTVRESITV